MTTSKDGPARTVIGQYNTIGVAMEDLHEAERAALKKELQVEMTATRRRNLMCFQKTRTKVIKRTAPAITTTTTTATTSTVTPNMTPEELVKLMHAAVARKYDNNLSNFVCIITDDVCSTLESFKTDL
jgi:hypothetical protein